MILNSAITTADQRRFWCTPGFLPEEVGIIVDRGQVFCSEGNELKMLLQQGRHNITVYSLMGMALNIDGGHGNKPHLVSMIDGKFCFQVDLVVKLANSLFSFALRAQSIW